ncbi:MAG: pilus assembly protein [Coriobacteriia bacterium]|nr:pilus assembly protein [Coriobacteriia bacterium]
MSIFGSRQTLNRQAKLDQRGQSTVELAVCLPVLLIMILCTFNFCLYLSACARFDPLAAEAVRTQATSPGAGEFDIGSKESLVRSCLVLGMGDDYHLSISVSVETVGYGGFSSSEADGILLSLLPRQERITCTMEFIPWGIPSSIFGISLPRLTHSRVFIIDPYRPGGLF